MTGTRKGEHKKYRCRRCKQEKGGTGFPLGKRDVCNKCLGSGETTRTCKCCNTEKPIDEYRVTCGYRERQCLECRAANSSKSRARYRERREQNTPEHPNLVRPQCDTPLTKNERQLVTRAASSMRRYRTEDLESRSITTADEILSSVWIYPPKELRRKGDLPKGATAQMCRDEKERAERLAEWAEGRREEIKKNRRRWMQLTGLACWLSYHPKEVA